MRHTTIRDSAISTLNVEVIDETTIRTYIGIAK